MGCGIGRSAYIIVEKRARLETPNDFRKQVNILIKKNPFYNTKRFEEKQNITKINEILNKISVENTHEQVSEVLAEINEILNLRSLFAENFKNIFIYGLSVLSSILPSHGCGQNILMIMILFLSNPNREVIKNEKMNIIRFLINTTKEDPQNYNTKRDIRRGSFSQQNLDLNDNNNNLKSTKQIKENKEIKQLNNNYETDNFRYHINENLSSNFIHILNDKNVLNSPYNYDNNMLLLRDNTKITNNNHKYKSGHFSHVINILISFFSYMFIYFFAMICLLSLDENQLTKLIVKKEKVGELEYNKINEVLLERFTKLNGRLNPNSFLACCLSFIFEPIKSLVKSQSDECLVEINDAEIDEIICRIAYIMNPYSIAEIFITLKVKDY